MNGYVKPRELGGGGWKGDAPPREGAKSWGITWAGGDPCSADHLSYQLLPIE